MLRDKNMSSSFKQFHKEYLMLKMYFNKSPVNTKTNYYLHKRRVIDIYSSEYNEIICFIMLKQMISLNNYRS